MALHKGDDRLTRQSKKLSESSLNAFGGDELTEKDWRLIDVALVDSIMADRQTLAGLPIDMVRSRQSIQNEMERLEVVRGKVQKRIIKHRARR